MNGLHATRERIDEIDRQLLDLFQQRMACADAIADYKQSHSLPILDRERELQKVERACESVPEELRVYASQLMECLMSLSRERQLERIASDGEDR